MTVTTSPEQFSTGRRRDHQLFRASQILMSRPLWWMEVVAVRGLLQLVGQEGCEPRATEMVREQLGRVVLEFPDLEIFRAAFRMQRSMIPAVARTVGVAAPLIRQRATGLADLLSAGEELVLDTSTENLCRVQVDNQMRQLMRTLTPWTIETLEHAAREAQEALDRIPIPPIPWFGPAHDPWLASWSEVSPVLECGLAVLAREPMGDPFITAVPELREAVVAAAQGHSLIRRYAQLIAGRAGLMA